MYLMNLDWIKWGFLFIFICTLLAWEIYGTTFGKILWVLFALVIFICLVSGVYKLNILIQQIL